MDLDGMLSSGVRESWEEVIGLRGWGPRRREMCTKRENAKYKFDYLQFLLNAELVMITALTFDLSSPGGTDGLQQ